jgi:hypothetical protein
VLPWDDSENAESQKSTDNAPESEGSGLSRLMWLPYRANDAHLVLSRLYKAFSIQDFVAFVSNVVVVLYNDGFVKSDFEDLAKTSESELCLWSSLSSDSAQIASRVTDASPQHIGPTFIEHHCWTPLQT